MKIDLIVKIKSGYLEWTKSERKVAEFVLENIEKMSYISVTELAEECTVGEATVLRFCKKIGYSGFHEFKKAVIHSIEKEEKKNKDLIINKTYDEMISMLNQTLKIQRESEIFNVAKLIKNAEHIYIYGSGLSILSARAMEMKLSFLGYTSFYCEEQHIQILKSSLVTKGDLIIGLSASGESMETVKNLKIAKKNGATIVGITNYNPSALANISDYVLLTASQSVKEKETTLLGLTSQLFVIEEVCDELLKIDEERIHRAKGKIFEAYR
ncbi:MurR/RpiR family transcriptional regulator [uncultured Clostridium sp.]|uniref:MurR/RpiR family transcriptional regulator n=1 Tax=uncultured Clostridium sp. TaxID=59620 RepID=UPI00262A25BE|nr:MurR/RpiR family transcriptional regulator [uncultured Clostridium sp.]